VVITSARNAKGTRATALSQPSSATTHRLPGAPRAELAPTASAVGGAPPTPASGSRAPVGAPVSRPHRPFATQFQSTAAYFRRHRSRVRGGGGLAVLRL